MKTLRDVPVWELSALEKLAALAPAEDETKKASGPPDKTPGPPRRRPGDGRKTLGKVDVAKYLDHYGVAYTEKGEKTARGGTIYRLAQCLFDAGHGRNEAAIIQDPDGQVYYQCFHNSCKGRAWKDARAAISGEDSLAQFCEGYDPEWRPRTRPVGAENEDEDGGKEYLRINEKGRVTFVPARMSDYLVELFKPILWEGKEMGDWVYRYHDSGVWKVFPESAIRHRIRNELGVHAKDNWIRESLAILKDSVYVSEEALKPDPMILNVKNGMLDVRTMELSPHAPEYHSRVQMPVRYDPDAGCTLWLDTVGGIFLDDFEKVDVLQDFFGYCLYPRILFPAALFQIGQGKNGKGVVEKVLCSMLGKENVSHISLNRMEKDFGPVELKDKLLNSCSETESSPLDVTHFKAIASGDEVQAEVKYKSDVKFIPTPKHMISMNSFPGVKERTNSFFRRIIVLEYQQSFEGKEDIWLADKLMKELNGIFMWAVEGLKRVLKNETISTPDAVVQAKERFRLKVNPVLTFVSEECETDKVGDKRYRVLPPVLYRSYKEWCEEAKVKALGKQSFYEQIRLNFPFVTKQREGTKDFYKDIGLSGDPRALMS